MDLLKQAYKYQKKGDFKKAIHAYEQAIALDQETLKAHVGLGTTYQRANLFSEARMQFLKALKRDPQYYPALRQLAITEFYDKHYETAFGLFKHVLKIKPNDNDLRMYYQSALNTHRYPEAVQALISCWQLEKKNKSVDPKILREFALHARFLNVTRYIKDLEEICAACFKLKEVCFQHLSVLACQLIQHKYQCVFHEDKFENDKLWHNVLAHTIICDSKLENALTSLRKKWFLKYVNEAEVDESVIRKLVPLSLQCLNNEFVYTVSFDEDEAWRILREKLENQTPKEHSVIDLVLYSLYAPLATLSDFDIARRFKKDVMPVIERSYYDYKALDAIAPTIESFSEINNDVSHRVRMQYEVHPYPRWLTLARPVVCAPQDKLKALLPHVKLPGTYNEKMKMLVAGGGTGQQPIKLALAHPKNKIVSFDLSRRSLAYAKRMIDQYKVKNLELMHGDLLDVGRLDSKFMHIECVGVLHHMASPMNGFKALYDILEPGGVMRLGFYSKVARTQITKARERIEYLGLSEADFDIRYFRSRIYRGDEQGEVLLTISDYYTLSGCRDLLFHEQERCYDLLEIKAMLDELGLTFIGFQHMHPFAVKQYKEAFPDDVMQTNLENWHSFEQSNPDTFRGMYQFYVQKKV